ncbi:MAG: hypothetical protein KC656_31340, partial [Myxococcales bacterium]|nr:hypothetical protein [Myxococcales bacterium]
AAGASHLDVQITAVTGSFTATLTSPDGVRYEIPGTGTSRSLDVDTPTTGAWKLVLWADGEGAGGVVPSWEIGGATGAAVIASQAYTNDTLVSLDLPGALGVLRSQVSGSEARHQVLSNTDDGCGWGSSCELVFPHRGSYEFEAEGGPGMLEIVWTPVELALDQQTTGGRRSYALDVPGGTTHLIARAPWAEELMLIRSGITLCSSRERCVVEHPAPGTWVVEVMSYDGVHVEAGVLGEPPPAPPTPPAPPVPDDHGDDFNSSTVLTYGSLNAHLSPSDSDWFDIAEARAGDVLSTLGSTDTFGLLYDCDYLPMAGDDDGGIGLNFHLVVPEGACYLEVRGYVSTIEGDYTLVLAAADDALDTGLASP